ncbi:MurR/RpiR family transcriptional regulator [Brevibacillus sp. B_LB10_24]|uniref:MurR/RpiR family transcriptional regulator n=1 Tax=Brevibacillus sp. B_LB10_24 TaxID=3380645 RepID=UPI0038BB0CF2
MPIEPLIKEKFAELSPGQKKVAEFLLGQMEKAAFYTAVQIGKEVDVSETTVIRLSYALGFNGFSQMQACIQEQVLKNHEFAGLRLHDKSEESQRENNPFVQVAEREIEILRQMMTQLNESDLWKAADWAIGADQVLVVGYRASYAAAYWFSFELSMLRDNVSLIPASGDPYEKLLALNEKSVAFAISFPRYTKETLAVAECAKQRGARLIGVTDRVLSPIGRISDVTFTTDVNPSFGNYSVSAILNLLNMLITAIGIKDEAAIHSRTRNLEQIYSNFGTFIE